MTTPTEREAKPWPFVETPGDFTLRLKNAIDYFGLGNLLGAVRHVLIENPAALLAADAQWQARYEARDRNIEAATPIVTWQNRIRKNHPTSDPQYWPDELIAKYARAEVEDLRCVVDALQAELDSIRKQAPVANVTVSQWRGLENIEWQEQAELPDGTHLLYLAAGAQQVAVPQGWQLVPVESTYEQRKAGFTCIDGTGVKVGQIYKAMLAAAPQPPQGEVKC